MKQYGVILADPPWQYSVNAGNGVAENHYSTMSKSELLDLPICNLVGKDSILLMWATWPFLPFAFELVSDWGFEYKTIIPWVKLKSVNYGLFDAGHPTFETAWGVGFWARGCTEPLIVAKKGNVKTLNDPPLGLIDGRDNAPVFLGPRLQHSRKLDNVYEYAESFPGPYLELFARRPRPGWDVFGNEVANSIKLPDAVKF